MNNKHQESLKSIERLLLIMDDLRAQCPWDKKQTMETLRTLTIEETYELADAIIDDDMEKVKKELGDLLLHIAFYSKIGDEKGLFNIGEVAEAISDKLVDRHPHIYGDVTVADEAEVKRNWEKLKLKEGKKSVLEGVPRSLPALVKAQRIQEKAAGIGFDWEQPEQVFDKVREELQEFSEEVTNRDQDRMESEFGDILFALINYARFLKINPENALERTNKKFIYRFQYLEERAREEGKSLSDMTLEEMDVYWEEAKRK